MTAKDFIQYIGAPCLIIGEPTPATIEGVDIIANSIICNRQNFAPSAIVLSLKPMSLLNDYTNDDLNLYTLGKVFLEKMSLDFSDKNKTMLEIEVQLYRYVSTVDISFNRITDIYKCLLENHFDVDNLIEKGLAIEHKQTHLKSEQ